LGDDGGTHVTDIDTEAVASDTSAKDLKACPFCGGRPHFMESGHGLGTVIRCSQCSARVEGDASKDDAIAQWQRRAH
jgi:Lar family restriction alleviation protein